MIRKATLQDLDSIDLLYKQMSIDRLRLDESKYSTSIQQNGFLLGSTDRSSLERKVKDSYEFLVTEEENKIVGFLIANHLEEEKFYDDEYKTWFNASIKYFYLHNPKGMSIDYIVVDPNWSGQGLATQMLNKLAQRLSSESYEKLFSIITISPITNCPSLIWHSKNGFKRLAMSKPREMFGFDWHAGILLYKDL
jgi:L-amino acid N-acyltransferase YncA